MTGHRPLAAAFVALSLVCLAPLFPLRPAFTALVAPAALVLGAAAALTFGNPFSSFSKKCSKVLLQASVVLLGFSMDIHKVLQAGRSGLLFSLVSIAAVYGLGFLLVKLLKVRPVTGLLVSTGTAICGGSAIAAVSTVVDAPAEDVSVSVGTVFLLNAIALLVFPPLGHALQLTETQFGVWAGIAIHDIASVTGAGLAYGPVALDTATAVKLSRVLYLFPLTIIIAWAHHRSARDGKDAGRKPMQFPWFVGFFLLASTLRSFVPAVAQAAPDIKRVAACGFALSLFLIGLGLSRATLKAVGVRPLVMGMVLWLFISCAALAAIRYGY